MKKLMIALTGLVTVATLGATVTVPANGITANAATKKTAKVSSPSLKVNALYNNSKTITGTATKGSKITVKSTQNAKKNLGSATASKKTGKYTVKLSKALKKNSNVYVYATNAKTKAYFFRIIRVQAAQKTATKKAVAKKTTTKKTTKKAVTKKTTKVTSPSLKVNTIYNNTKKLTGTATKGAKITVKSTKNAKKNLGSATASKTTGKYTVKLNKSLKANSTVYVYATNAKTKAYFYRIIHVQAAKKAVAKKTVAKKTTAKKTTAKKAVKKTTKKTTKKATKKATKNFTVKELKGTWKSNTANKYSQVWSFSHKNGFNQTLYKNGKKVKKLVAYGNYSEEAVSKNVWKLSYKANKKNHTVYLRYTAANKFTLVNAKNKAVKLSAGVAPAANWTFSQK